MKSRYPILAFVLMGLFCLSAIAQTQQTSRTVTVVGAVTEAGIYDMRYTRTLLRAVAMSGLQPTADKANVQVVRLKPQGANGLNLSDTITLDLNRILSGKERDF